MPYFFHFVDKVIIIGMGCESSASKCFEERYDIVEVASARVKSEIFPNSVRSSVLPSDRLFLTVSACAEKSYFTLCNKLNSCFFELLANL